MPFSFPSHTGGSVPSATLGELNELLWALPSSLVPQEIVAALLDRGSRLFQAPLACVWLREQAQYSLVGAFGFTEKKAEQLWQRLGLDQVGASGVDVVHLHGAELHAMGGFGKRRLGAVLAVPLISPRGPMGWLIFARLEPAPFTELEQQFIAFIANRVAQSLENAHRYQQTAARSQELELLNEIAQLLVSTTRLDELLERLAQRATETFQLTACTVHLYDPVTGGLPLRVIFPREAADRTPMHDLVSALTLSVEDGMTGRAFRQRTPIVVSDIGGTAGVPTRVRQIIGQGSALILPLIIRNEFVGVMYWYRTSRHDPLTEDFVPLASHLANQIAVGIDNARLYQELEGKVAERTAHLQTVYEQLAQRFSSGREFFLDLSGDLQVELGQVVSSASALDAELQAAEPSIKAAAAEVARLQAHLGDMSGHLEMLFSKLRQSPPTPS